MRSLSPSDQETGYWLLWPVSACCWHPVTDRARTGCGRRYQGDRESPGRLQADRLELRPGRQDAQEPDEVRRRDGAEERRPPRSARPDGHRSVRHRHAWQGRRREDQGPRRHLDQQRRTSRRRTTTSSRPWPACPLPPRVATRRRSSRRPPPSARPAAPATTASATSKSPLEKQQKKKAGSNAGLFLLRRQTERRPSQPPGD